MDEDKEDFTDITISAVEYDRLLTDSIWLQCLESAGVENWEDYPFAQDAFDKYIDEYCKVH